MPDRYMAQAIDAEAFYFFLRTGSALAQHRSKRVNNINDELNVPWSKAVNEATEIRDNGINYQVRLKCAEFAEKSLLFAAS